MRLTALALSLAFLSAPAPRLPAVAGPAPDTPRVPVLVELFTSEGCSDCPPADALLAELDRTQPVPGALIIPLEEHVDYWDHQGWRDPFSSFEFTSRQVTYAGRLRIASPYTPQMVVAGHWNVLGSSSRQAVAAIAAAARLPQVEVTLALSPVARERAVNDARQRTDTEVQKRAAKDGALSISISAQPLPGDVREPAKVWLAITEDGLASQVDAGENSGRHLQHSAVVRKLISAGHTDPGRPFAARLEVRLAPSWKRENLRVVAFLSGSSSGQILGAAISRPGQ